MQTKRNLIITLLFLMAVIGLAGNPVFAQTPMQGYSPPPSPRCFQISISQICVQSLIQLDATHANVTGTIMQTYASKIQVNSLIVTVYAGQNMQSPILATGTLNTIPLVLPSGVAVEASAGIVGVMTFQQALDAGYLQSGSYITIHVDVNACAPGSFAYPSWSWVSWSFVWITVNTCTPIPTSLFSNYLTQTYTVAQLEALMNQSGF